MTKNSKKYFVIILFVLVSAGVFSLFQRTEKNDNSTNSSAQKELYPEKSVTHGHGLAVDRSDSSKLYIATHHGLLLLQNDKDLYRIGKSKDDYMGFSPHPSEASIFFSSGHPSAGGNIGFQKSLDAGVTWEKVSDGTDGPVDFHAMAISQVNPNLVYGWFKGALQRSTDQGKTWEIVNREILPVSLTADTKNENTVYAATPKGQGVLVSRDRGATWAPLSPALEGGAVSTIAIHSQDSKILIVFSEKLGGMGKSIDGGNVWKKINATWNNETILHVAFDPREPKIIYALTHKNKLYKSIDTGNTWVQIF